MLKNLNLICILVFFTRILLYFYKCGVSREDAYKIVQRNAMKVWQSLQEGQPALNAKGESLYLQYLLADSELVGLLSKNGGNGEQIIRDCFEFAYYTKNVDSIFKRVFGE